MAAPAVHRNRTDRRQIDYWLRGGDPDASLNARRMAEQGASLAIIDGG